MMLITIFSGHWCWHIVYLSCSSALTLGKFGTACAAAHQPSSTCATGAGLPAWLVTPCAEHSAKYAASGIWLCDPTHGLDDLKRTQQAHIRQASLHAILPTSQDQGRGRRLGGAWLQGLAYPCGSFRSTRVSARKYNHWRSAVTADTICNVCRPPS